MLESTLYIIHYALVFAFGIVLSFKFCDVLFDKKSILWMCGLFIVSGALQLFGLIYIGEEIIWKSYPLITHLPLLVILFFVFHKRILSILASITTAYLCCQIINWIGILFSLSHNKILVEIISISSLLALGYYIFINIGDIISNIYNKDNKKIAIFAIVPIIYYIFDYSMSIYTNLLPKENALAIQFPSFFLSLIYLTFLVIYYREEEIKANIKRNEEIMRILHEQQSKDITNIKQSENVIKLLRHDMRFLLNNIALSLENKDSETALKLVQGYTHEIDSTRIERYCANDTLNYIFSDYNEKCKKLSIPFILNAEIGNLKIDEIMISSIISNALDNAINAQLMLPIEQRKIILNIKYIKDKILFVVKNPYVKEPVFINNIPTTNQQNHGYGVQSIVYMSEKLGGTCEFCIKDNLFQVRIII